MSHGSATENRNLPEQFVQFQVNGDLKLVSELVADALSNQRWGSVDELQTILHYIIFPPRSGRTTRKWVCSLASRLHRHFGPPKNRPSHAALKRWLVGDPVLRRRCSQGKLTLRGRSRLSGAMSPVGGPPESWNVPSICSADELYEFLGLRDVAQLDWLAGGFVQGRFPPRHYTIFATSKRNGHIRILEQPRPLLKSVQRRILHGILNRVPAHLASQGFRKKCGIRTHAELHINRPCLLTMDIKNFFGSIQYPRVAAIFRAIGYPDGVASRLAKLCTRVASREEIDWLFSDVSANQRSAWETLLQRRHLPQGAPTSPALANLAAFSLDRRLAALAAKCECTYSRYADDLAFSGESLDAKQALRIQTSAAAIIFEEGFDVNFRKTRIRSQSQRQTVTGVVVNHTPNVRRSEYEELKAILHNCQIGDPELQNRDSRPFFREYLSGRISHVAHLNPSRGQKLRNAFARIKWNSSE